MTDPQLFSGARLIFADTETTGVKPTDRIVELAYAELEVTATGGISILQMTRSLIDPEIPIPAEASGVHHITDEMVAEAPTLAEFLAQVAPPMTDPVVFFAHNAPFDKRFLAPVFPNIVGVGCTLRLARRFFPDAPNHKLDTLRYFLDLYKGNAHRADEDVRSSVDLLNRLLEVSGLGLEALVAAQNSPIRLRKLPFGKFVGQDPAEVAKTPAGHDWIVWLLGDAAKKGKPLDADLDYTLRAALRGELQ